MTTIEVVFPVFSIIALGYFLAGRRRIDIPTISEIAVNVTSPCLIFLSIAKREIVGSEWTCHGRRGLLLAAGFVIMFGVSGVSRNVILLDSIMPPAVFNVILAQKYDADPDAVASAILIGTLLSVVTTPIFLMVIS